MEKNRRTDESKNMRPTVKHGGGSLVVWSCMAANGVENLECIMDRFMYRDILDLNLEETATNLGLTGDYYFQQDNDP